MLKDKKILLCVTGGIAAFKAIDLASRLHKAGARVKTILTANAQQFVTPLNFTAITTNSVHTDMFTDADPIPHITLADWADLVVIAPATANMIAKAVHGIADDLMSSMLLAHTKPILWIPAMNVNMFLHPVTQDNINTLRVRGHHVLEPMTGMLACGYEGKGKYPPNDEIFMAIETYLDHPQDLKGIRILITTGATTEAIDPMRMITNRSSGRTGLSLARAAALRGATVTLIHAQIHQSIPYYLDHVVKAETVEAMYEAVNKELNNHDWLIMCAAVSDYRPVKTLTHKIKKGQDLTLHLVQTTDILAEASHKKQKGQKFIGFAADTADHESNARKKLKNKGLDMIVANDLKVAGEEETDVLAITTGQSIQIKGNKLDVAHQILSIILSL